jgi:EmrB/QacA subfamily drug resistance transporter
MLLLDLTVVSVALPDIRSTFTASFPALQWILDAYALSLAVFLLTTGSLADRVGRKRVFLAGLVIFVVSSVACGLAPDVGFLIGARVVQGIGGSVLFAVGPAVLGQEYHGKDRAKAFGVFGAVIGLAVVLGPLVGGSLSVADWRYIFLLNVPVGIVALAIAALRMTESREKNPHPVDWSGLISLCLGLALLVLAFLRGDTVGWGSLPSIWMFVGSAVFIGIFCLVETFLGNRAMLEMSLFRNITFIGISTATLLYSGAFMSVLFLEVSYLQNVLGLSPWEAGIRLMPLSLTVFAVAGISVGFAEKIPPRVLVGFSLVAVAAGLALVRLAGPASSWTDLLPSMIVTGIGMGLFNPARASLSIAVVPPEKAATASGMSETFYQVGTTIGVAALGALFQARVNRALPATGAGTAVNGQLGGAVAAGGGTGIASRIHQPGAAGHLVAVAHSAFVSGLVYVATVAAAVAFAGAVAAFCLIRKDGLHASAVSDSRLPPADLRHAIGRGPHARTRGRPWR